MAIFKVGQRVRMVRAVNHPETIGSEATILGPLRPGYSPHIGAYVGHEVEIDGFGRLNRFNQQMVVPPDFMVPLTDPKADAFIERMKKLEPLKEPSHV